MVWLEVNELFEDHKDCIETIRQMGGYLDRELTEDEVKAVELHLEQCGYCRSAFRWEQSVLTLAKKCTQSEEMPANLRDQIFNLLKD